MLPRWRNEVYNLNGAYAVMHRIVQKYKIVKGERGENLFGSLINKHCDRLKVRDFNAIRTMVQQGHFVIRLNC